MAYQANAPSTTVKVFPVSRRHNSIWMMSSNTFVYAVTDQADTVVFVLCIPWLIKQKPSPLPIFVDMFEEPKDGVLGTPSVPVLHILLEEKNNIYADPTLPYNSS